MKYKLKSYYADSPGFKTPLWQNVLLFPLVLLMWLTNYPPTRAQMYTDGGDK